MTRGEGLFLGGIIDRFAMAAVPAALLYLYFLNAWNSIPLACACAFTCSALIRRLFRGLPAKRRASAAQARAELLRIAQMDECDAHRSLAALIRRRWRSEAFELATVLKHPEASLSAGDVLSAWKAHRSAARLAIAATCPCEPRAAAYAATLRTPAVAIVDSRALMRLLRANPAALSSPAPVPSLRERLRCAWLRVRCARFSLRSAMLAVALLGIYLLRGGTVTLLCALALLFQLGVALWQSRIGKMLFDPRADVSP